MILLQNSLFSKKTGRLQYSWYRRGDGERELDACLFDNRPMSAVQEVTSSAATDPATIRSGAIDRLAGQGPGNLSIQTGHEPLPQWHGKYFPRYYLSSSRSWCPGRTLNFARLYPPISRLVVLHPSKSHLLYTLDALLLMHGGWLIGSVHTGIWWIGGFGLLAVISTGY